MESIGGETAWIGLDELRPRLATYIASRCADWNDVQDVVQETLLRAARYRRGLHDPSRLLAWTLRIASNVLSDRVRREQRQGRVRLCADALEQLPSDEPEPGGEDRAHEPWARYSEAEREDVLGELSSALDALRPDDQSLLRSYYFGAQSCRETAERCGIAPDAVKVRLFRARRRLLRALEERLAAPALATAGAVR